MIRIDHLVLTVAGIERSGAFYVDVLGMKVETFGAGRKALRFGAQRINLHEAGREFEPKAKAPIRDPDANLIEIANPRVD